MKNKFLKIKEADNLGSPYYYAERLGKDSVAFVLLRRDCEIYANRDMIGVINEFKPPLQSWELGAFGGSLDESTNIVETTIKEVEEESGYTVTDKDIHYCGKYLSSTQMNEYVHLFLVRVFNGLVNPSPVENKGTVKEAEVVWISEEQAKRLPCWKTQVILSKY